MSSTRPPEIRARHVRSNLDAIDALGPALAAKIRGRVDAEVIERVAAATMLGWFPIAIDVDLTVAVADELGDAGVRGWSRDAMMRSMETPLLAPLVRGARSLFGLTPHSIYRLVPRGYPVLYRNAGSMRYESTGPTQARIIHNSFPPELAKPQYLAGVAGALEAGYASFGRQGELQIEVAEDAVVYTAQWR